MPDLNKTQLKKLELLLAATDRIYPSLPKLMARSFIQGLFMGLGSTLGLAIIIALISLIVAQLKIVPAFSDFIEYWRISQYLPGGA